MRDSRLFKAKTLSYIVGVNNCKTIGFVRDAIPLVWVPCAFLVTASWTVLDYVKIFELEIATYLCEQHLSFRQHLGTGVLKPDSVQQRGIFGFVNSPALTYNPWSKTKVWNDLFMIPGALPESHATLSSANIIVVYMSYDIINVWNFNR